MSRNYATFATSIWRPDDDFGNLSMAAQWAYFMLSTQPDISAAGVLSLNVRRWSKRTKDGTREMVIAALQELQDAGKVFYDYDTEELLIRKFVRWDGGYGNQKRRPVIKRAALDLESPRLRDVLAEELRKLDDQAMASLADRLCAPYGIGHTPDRPESGIGHTPKPPRPSQTDLTAAPGPPAESAPEAESSQVDSLSDSVSLFDGVAVSTTTHNPQPIPPSAGADFPPPDVNVKAPARRRKKPQPPPEAPQDPTAQAVVAAFIDGARDQGRTVTGDVIKQVGSTAKRLLTKDKISGEELINAAREMGRRGWKDLNMQLLKGNGSRASPNGSARNAWQAPPGADSPDFDAHAFYAPPGGSS